MYREREREREREGEKEKKKTKTKRYIRRGDMKSLYRKYY